MSDHYTLRCYGPKGCGFPLDQHYPTCQRQADEAHAAELARAGEGWIEHDGGPMPVGPKTRVRGMTADGEITSSDEADAFDWEWEFWGGRERLITYRPEPRP